MSTEDVTNDELLIRYLLGTASAAERTQVEESFADDDTFFRFTSIEDQLTYDYLNNRLSETDKTLFEKNYLGGSSEREERFLFAKTLIEYGDTWAEQAVPVNDSIAASVDRGSQSVPTRDKRGVWIPTKVAAATVAVVLIAIGGLSWLAWKQRNEVIRLNQQQIIEEQNHKRELETKERQIRDLDQQLATVRSTPGTPEVKPTPPRERQGGEGTPNRRPSQEAMALVRDYVPEPSEGRGGLPATVITVPRHAAVPLILRVGATRFSTYQVEVEKEGVPSSRRVFENQHAHVGLKPRAIRLTISTETLESGTYLVSVWGFKSGEAERSPVETFRFRVE